MDNINKPPQLIIGIGNHAVSSPSNGTKEKVPTPESILNEAKELDFSKQNSVEVENFHKKYDNLFQRKAPKNFLHVLAERSAAGEAEDAEDAEDAEAWPKERLCSFMKWFLKNYSHFLTIKTESGVDSRDYPLHTAFSKRNYVFIEEVLTHPDIKILQQVLEQKTTSSQTYLHLAISSKSPVVKLVAQKCKEFSTDEVWKGYGEQKLTPLHVAVHEVHKFFHIVETSYTSDSSELVQSDDEIILSHVKDVLKGGLESACSADNQIIETVSIFDKWKRENLSSGGESQVKPMAVADLLLELIHDHQKPEGHISQVEVLRLLISLCDTVLIDKAIIDYSDAENKATKSELTPYQKRLLQLKSAWLWLIYFLQKQSIGVSETDRDEALRRVEIEDPVANEIRSHCLHNFDRDRIAKCLYQPGDGTNAS